MDNRSGPVVVIAHYQRVRASLMAVGQLVCFGLAISALVWLILNPVYRFEGMASPRVVLAMIDPLLMASLIIPVSSLYFLARVVFTPDYPAIQIRDRRLKLDGWWTRGIDLAHLEGANGDRRLQLKFRDGRSRTISGALLREPLNEIAERLNRYIADARQGR